MSLFGGSTGTVSGNRIIDLDVNGATNANNGACGIALAGNPTPVTINNNTIGNTQCGVAIYGSNGNTITGNQVFGTSVSDGVFVCGDSNTIQNNTIASSAVAGVFIDTSCGAATANNNTVTNNRINEACAGILVNPITSGNVFAPNIILNANVTEKFGTSCP